MIRNNRTSIHLLWILLITLCFHCVSYAQCVVVGHAFEYDGSAKSKPLSGVEIMVIGAGSVVTDANGTFQLQFSILKPGDRVRVRRINKVGYVVFNQEVVDEWVVPSDQGDHLTLMMCQTKKMDQLRQSYYKAAEKHSRQELNLQEKTLKDQLKRKEINQDEYNERLENARLQIEKNLDNVENFIDRFARVDVRSLGAQEAKILKLVKSGNFDEAMALYESENLLEKFAQQSRHIESQQSAKQAVSSSLRVHLQERDSIYSLLQRQIVLLRVSGGEENFNKITQLYKSIAYADTTIVKPMEAYAKHCYGQRHFEESLKAYSCALRHIGPDTMQMVPILIMKGASERMLYRSEQALESLSKAKDLISSSDYDSKYRALILYHLGHISKTAKDHAQALEYFRQGDEEYKVAISLDTADLKLRYQQASVQVYMGDMCDQLDRKDSALTYLFQAIKNFEYVSTFKPHGDPATIGFAHHHLAWVYDGWDSTYYASALQEYHIADSLYQVAMKRNPEAYDNYQAELYYDLGDCYMIHGDYQLAIEPLNACIKKYEHLKEKTKNENYKKRYQRLIDKAQDYIVKAQQAISADPSLPGSVNSDSEGSTQP